MVTATEPKKSDIVRTFEIVKNDVILEEKNPNDPNSKAVIGTVARCPSRPKGHEFIVRAFVPGVAGPLRFRYHGWAPNENGGTVAEHLEGADDSVKRLSELLATRPQEVLTLPPRESDVEVQRFVDQFPMIAARLKIEVTREQGIFDAGRVLYRLAEAIPMDDEVTRAIIARHGNGDFGLHGQHDPVVLTDPEQAWLVGLAPQSVKNTFTIAQGCGVVTSLYDPPPGMPRPTPLPNATPVHPGAPPLQIHVATLLRPGQQPTTFIGLRRLPW